MIRFVIITLYILLFYSYSIESKSKSSNLSPLTRRRILSELKELMQEKITLSQPFNTSDKAECGIRLSPIKGNMLEWHFSFTGIEGSVYADGIYHGAIRLDPTYPNKGPVVEMLSPSGRWEVSKPICLSASAYHPESWDSNWNLRTLVLSLRNFMTTQPKEIGGISTTVDERLRLARNSRHFYCDKCDTNHMILSDAAHIDMIRHTPANDMIYNNLSRALNSRGRLKATSRKQSTPRALSLFGSFLKKRSWKRILAGMMLLATLMQTIFGRHANAMI